MKKMKMLISFTLALVLLFSCLAAEAESCYIALRELMNSPEQENWYLGKGRSSSTDDGKDILAVYVEKDETFYIMGMNEYGKGEITIWNDISMLRGYYMIYIMSGIWETLQQNMDPGYSITLAITDMDQIEGDWIVDDAESAASFVQVMGQTFEALVTE